ncbi:DUF4178 domain-containing protein [Flammeovirga kamogawensis]|uniref:DUF4178 domain-containing protein n=1 Tax=Flammeovirga kamogawensis TaxID=373891 RepID=A0ABX8GVJ1_9BACT|nr:DUF4178 domain-containing protein [Flammeovirga kamogawensis]MBB6459593.1 hypothetical protein [Flammeovirga kamogawensis]QWG07343.1 DUF4178 domain-containing protein [Flammeovirga kamogawensis]TRX69160.1 DUF4178 domain-containing protein [Flammeovirga kamogawensis]
MPFGFFKKKKKEEKHYDPTNITIRDIRKGYVLDYDLQSWEVTEEFEYDWGDNDFSYEFKLESANDAVFLSIEDSDFLTGTISRKVKWGKLPDEVDDALETKGKPPKKIVFDGKVYYRDIKSVGYWRNIENKESAPYMVWEYYDDSEKYVLSLEQFDDEEFEASLGIVEEPDAFSNILPTT